MVFLEFYFPIAQRKPAVNATPFLPPFLIIVWKNPVAMIPATVSPTVPAI